MIKSLIFRLFSAFSSSFTNREDEQDAIIETQKNIKLTGSRAERLAAIKEWSKPENIAARMTEFEEQQVKLKADAKVYRELLGLPEEDPPLPDPLWEQYIGQAPSTIRKMLKHDGWVYDWNEAKWIFKKECRE